jgi:nucleoside-diphosphate-sugar epimerase
LGRFDALVDCVSSGHGGAEAYRKTYLEGVRNLLEFVRAETFLFTGSTSVYAQDDGLWVNEESPAEPLVETGIILREAEELVLSHGGIIARLAGIYGPGRWAFLQKFLDGTAVIEDGGGRWMNSIHRDDAASAVAFLLNNQAAPGIYNVSDGNPLTQIEYHQILASHFKKPLPPIGVSDPDRKRGLTSKRVSNAKLRGLGWQPVFASVRDALPAA